MYKSEEMERHEYDAEEVKRIVKKKGKKTYEEADVAEAIHEAEDFLPKGKTIKVVTETYHHRTQRYQIDDRQELPGKKQKRKPGDSDRLKLAKGINTDDDSTDADRKEYSQGEISLIVKKDRKTKEEREITDAVREAKELAPTGKPVKVITETYHHHKRPSKQKSKPKGNQVVPSNVLPKLDLQDKSYKEIFDYKLLPPLGFYRRDEFYLKTRKKYENVDDGRGVAMADKYWARQKNFTLRSLFVWPPKLIMRKLFWSFGYYSDAYSVTYRKSHSLVDLSVTHQVQDNLDSDDDKLADYDDEVFPKLKPGGQEEEYRKTSNSPWEVNPENRHKLTEEQMREFNAKTVDQNPLLNKNPDLKNVFTREEMYDFDNKEMLLYPWELEGRTVKKLNAYQLEDYKEVVVFCNQLIGPEEKKLNSLRNNMGQTEYKEFLLMRDKAKSKFVPELKSFSAKSSELLKELKEVSNGPLGGSRFKSLLILEYGVELVNSLNSPNENEDMDKMDKKNKMSSKEQDKKKKPATREGEDLVDSSIESSTAVVIGDSAERDNKAPLKSAMRPSKEEVQSKDRYKKSKSVELRPTRPGEGEKVSIGRIRRGTKHAPKSIQDMEDGDEEGDEEDKEYKNADESADEEDKPKFKGSNLKWAKEQREPKAKEAELWNSLPHNPKLHTNKMILARLPLNVEKSDLKELFPEAKICIGKPLEDAMTTHATITFSNYEACRKAYDLVRRITYKGKALVAIPKHLKDNAKELETFLRLCK